MSSENLVSCDKDTCLIVSKQDAVRSANVASGPAENCTYVHTYIRSTFEFLIAQSDNKLLIVNHLVRLHFVRSLGRRASTT
jgi:hypothetical protein